MTLSPTSGRVIAVLSGISYRRSMNRTIAVAVLAPIVAPGDGLHVRFVRCARGPTRRDRNEFRLAGQFSRGGRVRDRSACVRPLYARARSHQLAGPRQQRSVRQVEVATNRLQRRHRSGPSRMVRATTFSPPRRRRPARRSLRNSSRTTSTQSRACARTESRIFPTQRSPVATSRLFPRPASTPTQPSSPQLSTSVSSSSLLASPTAGRSDFAHQGRRGRCIGAVRAHARGMQWWIVGQPRCTARLDRNAQHLVRQPGRILRAAGRRGRLRPLHARRTA